MIPVNEKIVHESEGVDTTVEFSLNNKNAGMIFHILRNQLYSDAILAVIREYSTNAVDANVMAGRAEMPIEVSLPTMMDCFFKVRDFGNGLTDEEVQQIFVSYGESTKRGTDDATGMLGIGCKSGFSYNDQFIVNSYKGGVLTSWSAFIDPSKKGAMSKMVATETTEPDGLEIVIPVKHNDINKFHEKAFHLFSFFKIAPKLNNITEEQKQRFESMRARKVLFQGDNWKFMGDNGQSYAVMGNIPYPISSTVLGSDMRSELQQIVKFGIIIQFNIGELEFAANREALQYTPHTKKNLLLRLEEVLKALVDDISKKFSGCKTLWDAKCLFRETFDLHGQYYNMRAILANNVTFNGKKITSNNFNTQPKVANAISTGRYMKRNDGWGRASNRVSRTEVHHIEAENSALVVENDKDIKNAIVNRVVGLIESGKYKSVYVIKFADEAAKKEWLADSQFDGELVKLSTLPKEALSKYYPDLRSGTTGFTNPKHATTEFEFNNTGTISVRSDYWKTTTVDVEKDSGVYIEIDRFEAKGPNNYFESPSIVRKYLAIAEKLGITLPARIYGFKSGSAKKAAQNKNMQTFWDWFKTEFNNLLNNNPALEQQFIDRRYVAEQVYGWVAQMDSLLNVVKWTKGSRMDIFAGKVKAMYHANNATQLDALFGMKTNLNVVRWTPKVTAPSQDLKAEFEKLSKRYHLAFKLARANDYHSSMNYDPETSKALAEYADLIDLVTP
jgi:hypothetical protein